MVLHHHQQPASVTSANHRGRSARRGSAAHMDEDREGASQSWIERVRPMRVDIAGVGHEGVRERERGSE